MQHFDGVEVETGPNPPWSVIWLHGLGADGHDFEPIVPELVDEAWPAVRFVFPHAPVRAVTINGGVRMRAWYDILGLEIAQRQDEGGVRESIAFVQGLIARENARGVPSERIVVAGFSQGGAIALASGLRHPERLAGVVALSTYLPIAESSAGERSEANRALPIFMAHGSLDPVVGHALGQMSRSYLEQLGYAVQWHSYSMPHSVNAEEIADLARWLGERFAPPGG
ncbi:MAG: alpha/beta hydrolase [Chiayiivirga sp.]|jgi:phospholipase/carboxylesterase|uniref:alpha/beta hydrolase n=1 Tax=Chiayiivirga sp. TaxID=2041042 RepID=UPI0025BB387D|nr:alpha/beta hydrolase [Chiayiivirga sp.]MCI1711042.1 alpha/beta hydrolase [Chiayiivirga sp.]MCI1728140.1 alpha/beta hydrolase [Chiayiivirga sp.]